MIKPPVSKSDDVCLHNSNMTPAIGIFWFVLDRTGTRFMLSDGCCLSDAEPYGDCLTYAPGHCDVWSRWRLTNSFSPGLSDVVHGDEYDDWPRGRIVFDRAADHFVIYADRRITAARLTDEVCRHFRLPADRVVVRHDQHYRSPRSIKAADKT